MSRSNDPTADDPFMVDLDAKGLKSRALRGAMLSGSAQIAKMALQLGSTIILGRLLFPADFGLVAMVYPVIGFVQLFGNFGFVEAVVQRQDLRREDASSLFWLNMMISLGLAFLGVVLSPVTAWMYGEPRVTILMATVAATLPLNALGSIHGAILSRQMRFGTITRNDLTAAFSGILVTIGCALLNFGYWSLVIGQIANTLVATLLVWVSLQWRPFLPAFSKQIWDDIRFGVNLTGANLATFVTSAGDNVIIGVLNGKDALGIYDRSYRLVVQPLGQMLAPISSVAVPLLSRLQSDVPEYRNVYLGFVRLILLFNTPISLVCVVNSKEIVTLLLGPHWEGASNAFSWISVGGIFSGFYSSLTWLFISQARTASMRRYMSVSAIFNLASFAVGAIWGVEGVAACAATVFISITVPLVVYGATRSGPVGLRAIVLCCLPNIMTGILAFIAMKFTEYYWLQVDSLKLLTSTILCLSIFLIASLILPWERKTILFGLSKILR